jgi:hypothetical protein
VLTAVEHTRMPEKFSTARPGRQPPVLTVKRTTRLHKAPTQKPSLPWRTLRALKSEGGPGRMW